MMRLTTVSALGVGLLALLWGGVLFPQVPKPSDPDVAALSERFQAAIDSLSGLSVSSIGQLVRDRDTLFWSLFADQFGSNPNTPYMWNALPAFGYLLPSPMWNLRRHDAVVMLARLPPRVEYFSFTSFALWMPRRGLPFSSLGDSINTLNIQHTDGGVFAHVLTANRRTFALVEEALRQSGLPANAINMAAVPADLGGLFDDWTHFETVLRLFRFANQTEGDAYLKSHQPVFYLKASHGEELTLPTQPYKDRTHPDSAREGTLEPDFINHSSHTLSSIGQTFDANLSLVQPTKFAPLMIQGLECLKHGTECLGDCPDAAYFGPNIHKDTDDIETFTLSSNSELHVVTVVNHRLLNVSNYASIAMLKSSSQVISKTRMKIRATSLGVTSFDFPLQKKFVSWAFTRNPEHCVHLNKSNAVDGCSVLDDSQVARDGHLTYCERVYLNPATATGPDWADVLPARLYHIKLDEARARLADGDEMLSGLPPSAPFLTFDNAEPLRFLHIIKTGGESLELHLAQQQAPHLDFSTCRKSALAPGWQSNMSASTACSAMATTVSTVLCGLNCECCADDIRLAHGGFHGTLLRSPRAHALSIFTQCHTAHTQNTWGRIAEDVTQYLAEGILRGTEFACGSYCTNFNPDWGVDLRKWLVSTEQEQSPLRVVPLHNFQSHALTCSTSHGSLGQHFRVLEGSRDSLQPPLDATLAALHRFEWVGLTDLYEHSVCLLHFQANGSLPPSCDCNSPSRLVLPKFTHGVKQHDPQTLPQDVLAQIDAHTAVDAKLFANALRLLLGRLRRVEEMTGASLLPCIDWRKLWRKTDYIPGLWAGPGALVVV